MTNETSVRVAKTRVFILQIHLTDRCNLRCTHCYQDNALSPEMTLDQVINTVDQFQALCNSLKSQGQLTFTGGEPFVRHDFFNILGIVASQYQSLQFGIMTNGTLLTEHVVEKLSRLHPVFVQVSIDGDEGVHDNIRGAGNHARTLHGLEYLHSAGIRSLVSFTAHQQNFRDFPKVVDAAILAGATRVWTDRLVPIGNAERLNVLTPEQTHDFFNTVRKEQIRCDQSKEIETQVAMRRALQFLVTNSHPYRCSAGRRLLAVLPDGLVYPCRRLPIPIANVLSTPLAEIYHNARRLMRDSKSCTSCQYATTCAGGLRCLAYAISGNLNSPDPGCWLH